MNAACSSDVVASSFSANGDDKLSTNGPPDLDNDSSETKSCPTTPGQARASCRPLLLRTRDGKMLIVSSSSGSNESPLQLGGDQAKLSGVRIKGHQAMPSFSVPTPSALSKLVNSSDSPASPSSSASAGTDSGATRLALSFRHALCGSPPSVGNGSSGAVDDSASSSSVDDGKEASCALPKIRFSFPSLAGRLGISGASSGHASPQANTAPSHPPRFVIVKSSSSPPGHAANSTMTRLVNSNAPRQLVTGLTAARTFYQQRPDCKPNFITAAVKRKLQDDPRSVITTKSVSNVYLLPAANVTASQANHNFQTTLATDKAGQNGKLLYISPTDALVALKESSTIKKRQLMNNRRPCNCTKSQCLKLYCDCFANGEFCSNCHCTNCLNNLTNENDRSKAIKSCLERNPMAFQPKIGKGKADTDRLHNKGCNCKKSSCLKNYCECYEARVSCTVRCKCFGCRNTEADRNNRSRGNLTGLAGVSSSSPGGALHVYSSLADDYPSLSPSSSVEDLSERQESKRLPKKFINDDVIEAITRVMVATAEDLSNNGVNDDETMQIEIIKAYGTCLSKLLETVSI